MSQGPAAKKNTKQTIQGPVVKKKNKQTYQRPAVDDSVARIFSSQVVAHERRETFNYETDENKSLSQIKVEDNTNNNRYSQ